MDTTPKPKKSLQYYARAIHRVLGYLAVGMVMVYALSGITLIHRTGNFMKHSTQVEATLAPGLTADQLAAELKIKNMKVTDETPAAITFADGVYDRSSGHVSYAKKELHSPLNKFVDLHKLPDAKNHAIAFITTIFGIVLFLLALTSLFIFKPKTTQFKVNMIYTALGVILTIVLVILA